MPLVGNSKQTKSTTIREFYMNLSNEASPWPKIGQRMIEMIGLIDELFVETIIFGLTSHEHLNLQNQDNWNSTTFVSINSKGSEEYYFEYTIPSRKAPWQNATVQETARDLIEAKKYLLIAMRESEGWINSIELQNHLLEIE